LLAPNPSNLQWLVLFLVTTCKEVTYISCDDDDDDDDGYISMK
jgi:hypothetical protein